MFQVRIGPPDRHGKSLTVIEAPDGGSRFETVMPHDAAIKLLLEWFIKDSADILQNMAEQHGENAGEAENGGEREYKRGRKPGTARKEKLI